MWILGQGGRGESFFNTSFILLFTRIRHGISSKFTPFTTNQSRRTFPFSRQVQEAFVKYQTYFLGRFINFRAFYLFLGIFLSFGARLINNIFTNQSKSKLLFVLKTGAGGCCEIPDIFLGTFFLILGAFFKFLGMSY